MSHPQNKAPEINNKVPTFISRINKAFAWKQIYSHNNQKYANQIISIFSAIKSARYVLWEALFKYSHDI